MFLEYLDYNKYEEFTCDSYFSQDHQLKCVVPRKRIEVREGEVYKALNVRNTLVGLFSGAIEIFKAIKSKKGCIGIVTDGCINTQRAKM